MNNQKIKDFIIKYIKPLDWDETLVSKNVFNIYTYSFNGIYYNVERETPEDMFVARYKPRYGDELILGEYLNYYDAKVACQNHHNESLLREYFKIETVNLN